MEQKKIGAFLKILRKEKGLRRKNLQIFMMLIFGKLLMEKGKARK